MTILSTERLIIREPIEADFETIWAMKNDRQVMAYTGGVSKLSFEEAREAHKKRCSEFNEKKGMLYSVALKETDAYIGYCGFQYCNILEGVEILYGFSREHWGKGYAVEAAKAVLKYGLDDLKLGKILAAVNPENTASEKTLMRIGMDYLGKVSWPNQGEVNKYGISKT